MTGTSTLVSLEKKERERKREREREIEIEGERERERDQRHDWVLQAVFDYVNERLPDTTSVAVDLHSDYQFPTHITNSLRPDIIYWDHTMRNVFIIELMIPYDTLLVEAAQRKEAKYSELVLTVKKTGYRTNFVPLEVGSRGLPHTLGSHRLKSELGLIPCLHWPTRTRSHHNNSP